MRIFRLETKGDVTSSVEDWAASLDYDSPRDRDLAVAYFYSLGAVGVFHDGQAQRKCPLLVESRIDLMRPLKAGEVVVKMLLSVYLIC